MGADQLAMVADEAMAARGADLAVVVDGKRVSIVGAVRAGLGCAGLGCAGRRGARLSADGRTTL